MWDVVAEKVKYFVVGLLVHKAFDVRSSCLIFSQGGSRSNGFGDVLLEAVLGAQVCLSISSPFSQIFVEFLYICQSSLERMYGLVILVAIIASLLFAAISEVGGQRHVVSFISALV